MTELMNELYYMVDEWASQQDKDSGKAKDLQARLSDIEDEIELRLGEGGRELLEVLTNLSLELEDIHDQALFRAAMGLGAQIAQPVGAHTVSPPLCTPLQRAGNTRPYSTSR